MSIGALSCNDIAYSHSTGYLLGGAFNLCLYGVLTVQLYLYYITFPNDRMVYKVVTYVVYTAEAIYTYGFTCKLIDISAKTTSPNHNKCVEDYALRVILALCGAIVAFLAQSIYAYRIRLFAKLEYITKLKYISTVIFMVVTLQFVASEVISILPQEQSFSEYVIICASVSASVDITITCIMIWILTKDKVHCKQFQKKITRLVYLVVGTGFLTAAANIFTFASVLFAADVSAGLLLVLPVLYANAMMVLLNSRNPSPLSTDKEAHHRSIDIITVRLGSNCMMTQAATTADHGQQDVLGDSSQIRSDGDTTEEQGSNAAV